MAINYKIIEADGTHTDVHLDTHDMDLMLSLTYYESGLHIIQRVAGDPEYVTLASDPNHDIYVTVYLMDDPEYGDLIMTEQVSVTKTNANGEQYMEMETQTETLHNQLLKNEGVFIIDSCRAGVDQSYQIDGSKLVMVLTSFTIPKGFIGKLSDLNMNVVKVVEANG